MADIRIDLAAPADFDALCRLLLASKLPVEDLDANKLDGFLLARQAGELIGSVGLELRGDTALLRSLAVADEYRSRELGARLASAAEQRAANLGVRVLYLLTTTAADYFAKRGYHTTPRADAPAVIGATAQFSGLCPSSSTFMSKTL